MGLITSDVTFDVLIFIASVTLAIYYYVTRNFNYWKEKGIRSTTPKSIFGDVTKCLFAIETPAQLMQKVYDIGGNEKICGLYVLNDPYLMIKDPEIIRHVLVKDFSNFTNRLERTYKDDILGQTNLFIVYNPPWKYIRHKMSPIFSSGKLKKMFYLMLEISKDLQNHLESLEIDDVVGKTIECKDLAAKYTTDMIGSTAFGLKFNSLNDPNAAFIKKGGTMFQNKYHRYLQYLTMLLIPKIRSLTKPYFFGASESAFLRHSFWLTMNQRKKTEIRRNDVIDLLIDLQKEQDNDENDEYKLEGDVLLAQASVFFLGGFETSSTAISFTLYELARNPDIQRRLRKEIQDAMEENDGQITYEMVTTLPYLDMVLSEELRIYPTLSYINRVPENDYIIPGTNVTIPKGIPFILPVKMLQNDPQYFPDPEKFDPERFSEENKKKITPYTYLPFGDGPRNCIGTRLGLIQSKLGIAEIITKYEVSICEKTEIPVKLNKYTILTQPANGIHLNFRRIY